jgi:hypothetical protein
MMRPAMTAAQAAPLTKLATTPLVSAHFQKDKTHEQ